MKAIWNNKTLAESDDTIVVEGNHYFPEKDLNQQFFTKTKHNTVCPWKGTAHYYSLQVEGKTNENAAWYYPEPKVAAKNIKNYVAFWNGVNIVD